MNKIKCSTLEEYHEVYKYSINHPEEFWSKVAENFFWKDVPKVMLEYNFNSNDGPIYIKWMAGAKTNICYNIIDRVILRGLGNRIAYYWEGNDGLERKSITYSDLKKKICKLANALKILGIKKGDRLVIYMTVSIECVVAMLACARLGAIHNVVFSGLSAQALADRIISSNCSLLISSDGYYRGEKLIILKNIVDTAFTICEERGYKKIQNIVTKHTRNGSENIKNELYQMKEMDIYFDDLLLDKNDYCSPIWVDAEDPLFILYTSGSSGNPKGILHTIGGYLLHSYLSFKHVFNYSDGDIFLSTADFGWVTAHTFSVYGALANAASIVIIEGIPNYPHPGRIWEIIERLNVNILYTAPTAIRNLMNMGKEYLLGYNRETLKVIGVAGEPINPEAWYWLKNIVGEGRCPVVDTYWQTETGAPMLTSLAGCTPTRPGFAGLPFFGIVPEIVDQNGNQIVNDDQGYLVFNNPWPGIGRTIDGRHDLFEKNYFNEFPGSFSTGDGVKKDINGFFKIMGRIDDVINVSGHRLSTVDIESAILENLAVIEAAAFTAPDPLKSEVIFVFVVLKNCHHLSKNLEKELKLSVRNKIGAYAQPYLISSVRALPKTKSGKIMRRILYKIARKDFDFGDTSILADESVLNELKLAILTI